MVDWDRRIPHVVRLLFICRPTRMGYGGQEDEGDDDDIHSFRFIIICKLLTLGEVEEGLLLFAMKWTTECMERSNRIDESSGRYKIRLKAHGEFFSNRIGKEMSFRGQPILILESDRLTE